MMSISLIFNSKVLSSRARKIFPLSKYKLKNLAALISFSHTFFLGGAYQYRQHHSKMPRKPLITREEAIACVEKHINHFLTSSMPTYSDPIWKQMSKDLDGKWTSHNVYTSVRLDRRGILSTARENLGVVIEEEKPIQEKADEIPKIEESDEIDSDDNSIFDDSKLLNINDDLSDFELDAEASGLSQFDVLITREDWHEIKGQPTIYGNRVCPTLNRGVWTHILALAVARQTKLPCAFVFDNSRIYESPNSLHYLRIKGHCKSKSCQNPFFGYVDRDPGDNDFYMTVRTRDTLNGSHEIVSRPVRAAQKKKMKEDAKKKKCEEVLTSGSKEDRQHTAKYVNIFMCRRCNYPNVIVPKKDNSGTSVGNHWVNHSS